jgi:hypothetical protein
MADEVHAFARKKRAAISPPARSGPKKEMSRIARKGRTKVAKTVADQFAETLATAGIKRIYGIAETA